MKILTEKLSNGNTIEYHQLDNGTCYNVNTPVRVVEELEKARLARTRLRVYYGSQETGYCWMEENDTIGRIGRTTGNIKFPLLIKTKRSFGGGAILDRCIIKITVGKRTAYQHPKFHMPAITIVDLDPACTGIKYGYSVNYDGTVAARFRTEAQAERYVAFVKGERQCK